MLLQILKGTPIYVWAIFGYLIFVGYQRTKPQKMSKLRILILPALLIALSIYGNISAFGFHVLSLGCWLVAVAAAIGVSQVLKFNGTITYFPETKLFEISGSWFPLMLMLGIFVTKYTVGVLSFQKPGMLTETWFVISVSLAYGFFSGMFLSRAVHAFAALKKNN